MDDEKVVNFVLVFSLNDWKRRKTQRCTIHCFPFFELVVSKRFHKGWPVSKMCSSGWDILPLIKLCFSESESELIKPFGKLHFKLFTGFSSKEISLQPNIAVIYFTWKTIPKLPSVSKSIFSFILKIRLFSVFTQLHHNDTLTTWKLHRSSFLGPTQNVYSIYIYSIYIYGTNRISSMVTNMFSTL